MRGKLLIEKSWVKFSGSTKSSKMGRTHQLTIEDEVTKL